MELPEVKVIARWMDRLIAVLWVGNLAWVTWQLGGVLPGTMVVGLPWAFGVAGWVALRWWVIAPTGAPRGWWVPLPLLAWVTGHMLGLAELPSRGWLHGWHMWSGLAAYWVGLHLARERPLWRLTMGGIGIVAAGVVSAAIYQRWGDATWLPLGRNQVDQFLGRSAGTFGYPNAMAVWLAMILPAAVALAGRPGWSQNRWGRVVAGVVAVGALVAIGLSYSRGVVLALVVVGTCAWWFRSGGSWPRRLGLVASIGVIFAAAMWWGYGHNPEIQQRVDSLVEHKGERTRPLLWSISGALWQDRPWVGYGGDSYGELMELHRPEGLWESASHAHNDYLNGLSDYGLVGGLLAAAGLGVLGWQRRRRAADRPGVGLGLSVLMVAITIDFHLQVPAVWWLFAMMLGGWSVEDGRDHDQNFTDSKRGGAIGLGAAVALGCWLLPLAMAVSNLQAEELRWRARETLAELAGETRGEAIRPVAQAAVTTLRRAAALDAGNEQVWRDLSYALSLHVFGEPERQRKAGVEAEMAAREALQASELVAEHWLRLGVALDMQNRWAEAGPAFGRAINLAPRQPLAWYYQGFHLSLKPATRELAKAALATCLRLDPWHDEAKLLLADLERTP